MKTMKKICCRFLTLALCAAMMSSAAWADGDFNAKLTVDRTNEENGVITVTVEDSSVLDQYKPTLSIPCTFAYAKVTFGGQEVLTAAPVNGQVSFPVAAGGTYTIEKTDAPGVTHTVSFNSQGGTALSSQTVAEGDNVAKPADPTRSGYAFGGWYKESDCTTAWDFDTDTVTGDITLYAKWSAVTPPPTPSTPVVMTDKNEGTTSTTVKPSVNTKGEVNTTVSSSTANALVSKTIKDGTDNAVVEVKPAGSREVKEVKAELPAKALANLAEKSDADLTVATPVADVTISNEALAGLSDGAQKVTVMAAAKTDGEKGETSCEVTILKDGEPMGELVGEMKVVLPVGAKTAEEAGKGLVAVLVNEDGSETIVTKSALTEDGELAVLLKTGTAVIKYVDNAKTFADEIPDWANDAVRFSSSRRLFLGVSDSEFGSDETMNRAMLVTVLHRLEGKPAAKEDTSFEDVDTDSWYADSAAWSAETGIVLGTGTGFDGERPITRQDLALVLYRYVNIYGGGKGISGDFSQMGGADDVADYAEEAMRWAVGSVILIGDENNDLAPQRETTRAEVSVMLMRFVELLTK